MKQIAIAITILFTLGLSGPAIAGPMEPSDTSQRVDGSVVKATPSKGVFDVLGGKAKLEPDIRRSEPMLVRYTRTMAPPIDPKQPPLVIDPPIIAGTIREDPPGTGLKREKKKSKKKNWLQRKLFGS